MHQSILYVIALSALSFAGSAFGETGQGSLAIAPTPEQNRVSQYQQSVAADVDLTTSKGAARAHGDGMRAKTRTPRSLREKSAALSPRSGDFYFYDASVSLISDRDADGYFSEFRVRFDADSLIGLTRVYAKLYLRRLGESEWFLYRETDDFWVEGVDHRDDYYVTTVLDEGYATGEYDVLIDLYESGYSGIVATIGPNDTNALGFVPLEEVGLDAPIQLGGFSIGAVNTLLQIDDDGDGHYSQFRIEFDPGSDIGSQYVYARIWVRPQGGAWIEEHVTDDFVVNSSGSQDSYRLTADWISGYPTAYYDVQIDLFDAATNLLVASAGSERPAFAQIPLEDASRDVRPNPPVSGGGGINTSRERGGGGAFSVLGLALVLLGAVRRCLKER